MLSSARRPKAREQHLWRPGQARVALAATSGSVWGKGPAACGSTEPREKPPASARQVLLTSAPFHRPGAEGWGPRQRSLRCVSCNWPASLSCPTPEPCRTWVLAPLPQPHRPSPLLVQVRRHLSQVPTPRPGDSVAQSPPPPSLCVSDKELHLSARGLSALSGQGGRTHWPKPRRSQRRVQP